jgi:hypothetical protein
LNCQIKEVDILKQAAEIIRVSKADVSSVCLRIIIQVKEMTEGLRNLNILVCKQEARLESGKVWWNYL